MSHFMQILITLRCQSQQQNSPRLSEFGDLSLSISLWHSVVRTTLLLG